MKIREMLKQLAIRYEDGGPISRQRDAAALLRLADSLDEESAPSARPEKRRRSPRSPSSQKPRASRRGSNPPHRSSCPRTSGVHRRALAHPLKTAV